MYARDVGAIATPIGLVAVRAEHDRLIDVTIGGSDPAPSPNNPMIREALAQLAAWFDGRLRDFDLPLATAATPRGEILRAAIRGVPFGEMASYGDLAAAIGSSARAVGQACARNPFPIIVPCHRIVGSSGALGHFSGGDGPATKLSLLDHERHIRENL